jgi:hypothetical protein
MKGTPLAAPTGMDIMEKGRLWQPRPEQILYERDASGSPDRYGYYGKGTPSAAPTGTDII